MKPYYQHGGITILHADSRDALKGIDSSTVGLLLTDPPYGIGLNSEEKKSRKLAVRSGHPQEIYGDNVPFDPSSLLCYERAILWGANCYADLLPRSPRWLVWDKVLKNGLNLRISEMEMAWTNCVSRPQIFRHLWSGAYRATEQHTHYHPTQKPVALMKWCIGLVGFTGLVLDPYMGAGSVLLACKELGIPAMGIEIEERYCETAAKRLQQEVFDFGNEEAI